jgi:hypothetical protein
LGINYFKIVSESAEIEGFKNTRSGTQLLVQLGKEETVREVTWKWDASSELSRAHICFILCSSGLGQGVVVW